MSIIDQNLIELSNRPRRKQTLPADLSHISSNSTQNNYDNDTSSNQQTQEEHDCNTERVTLLRCNRSWFFTAQLRNVRLNEKLVDNESFDRECPICLDEHELNDFIGKTVCNHHFHVECITKWINNDNHTCPKCRHILCNDDRWVKLMSLLAVLMFVLHFTVWYIVGFDPILGIPFRKIK